MRIIDTTNAIGIKYDQFCRNKNNMQEDDRKQFVLRFTLPTNVRELSFDDLIRGTITINIDQIDDFIVMRSDGTPVYNFVVVADDAFMKISHVIRGEDHINNTHKQLLLYKALEFTIPQFAHLPLILGSSGERLSKRNAVTSVQQYRQDGFLPDALINYLVRLGWSHGNQEIFSQKELIELFDLSDVQKKGAIFDTQKLLWLNNVYLQKNTATGLISYIEQYLDSDFTKMLSRWSKEQIHCAINVYKERVHTIVELINNIKNLYIGPSQEEIESYLINNDISEIKPVINDIVKELEKFESFQKNNIQEVVKRVAKKHNTKMKVISMALRFALIGSISGPGIFSLFECLEKKEAIQRIEDLFR